MSMNPIGEVPVNGNGWHKKLLDILPLKAEEARSVSEIYKDLNRDHKVSLLDIQNFLRGRNKSEGSRIASAGGVGADEKFYLIPCSVLLTSTESEGCPVSNKDSPDDPASVFSTSDPEE